MPDREKVIQHFEDALGAYGNERMWRFVKADILEDAITLLKAQEPRVLTLEEVEDMPYEHVLIETDKSDLLRWLDALLFCKNVNFSFDFITLGGRVRLLGTEYNREWRCWTAIPTDKQRGETPWKK